MLRELYNGKVIPWERHSRCSAEQLEIMHKITAEEEYLAKKMSPEDCKRFKALSELYSKLSISEETEIFAHGFSFGVLVMVDVMDEAKTIYLDN